MKQFLHRKFSWRLSAVIILVAVMVIWFSAEPVATLFRFHTLLIAATIGGILLFGAMIAVGIHSARRRQNTVPQLVAVLAVGSACLVLWYWLPVIWCGGFLVPFAGSALITLYVQSRSHAA